MAKTRKPLARKRAQPRSAAAADRKPNVSPQDQAMFDRVTLAARKVLYGDPGDDSRFKFVLQRLAGSKGQIPFAIGQIAVTVLANISGTAAKQGRQIPGYILFHAGQAIIGDLVQIAVSAKLLDPSQAKAATEEAVMVALKSYKNAATAAMSGGQPAPGAGVAPAVSAPAGAPQPQPQSGIVNAARGM